MTIKNRILAKMPALLAALAICLAANPCWSGQNDKAAIAVLAVGDFVPDVTGTDQSRQTMVGLPDALAERLLEHLTQSKRFTALERKALRRAIVEQRFGKNLQKTYLDRTLDKAIASMDSLESGLTVAATGTLAGVNDLIHDFKDLGSAVGAEYLVVGTLEKMQGKTSETAVPYSTQGRKASTLETDARLRLRVIKVSSSSVIGAVSLRVKTSEQLFQGKKSDTDEFSAWDRLGTAAAAKILDVVYPATVVNLDPLTISRGANDGVRPEQTFAILRQGKPITDASGATIAHLEDSVGKVQAVKVDQNISLVKPLEGKAFKKGDLAREETPAAGSGAADAPLPSIRPGAAPTPGQMPKVAVGLIKEGSTAAVKEEKSIPIFTDTIITRLTQTKRFHMLDRQEVDQLLTEQLAQSMRDGKDMQSAFGSLKGADYFVYGSVAVLNVEEKRMKLPGSDRVITYSDGNVQGNMRVVDVKGGQIVESRQVKIQRRIDEPGSVQRVFANLADAFAEEVVASLMNALFPIKVAALAPDGTVYLNRGSDGGLKANEVLTVMRLGQKVVDPDTGVSLGAMETAVAKLTLVEVEDARAKARLESGTAVQPGDVVKRSLGAAALKGSAAPAATGATLPGSDAAPASGQAAAQAKGKATLAVGLVRLNPSARTTDVKPGHMERITDELVNALNNTNRFVVMERREVDRVLDEKTFTAIAGGDDIRERIKQLKGADYLVMGEVTNFYYDTERRKVPYVNEMEIDRTGVMEGNFRIVNGQTGAVVASDKVRLRDQVKNVQDPTRLMTGLMDRFVTQTVGKVVENIYPVKVLAVAQDGMVYLNRGEDGGLKAGVHFEVMRPGPELKDPDTGVSFGREEIKIGLLEVVTVEKFRSKGRLTSNPGATGSNQTVNAGDILRQAGPGAVPKVAPKAIQPKW